MCDVNAKQLAFVGFFSLHSFAAADRYLGGVWVCTLTHRKNNILSVLTSWREAETFREPGRYVTCTVKVKVKEKNVCFTYQL